MYKGNSGKQKKTKMQVLRMYKSSTEYLPSTQVLENYFGFLGERKKGKKKKKKVDTSIVPPVFHN